MIELFVRIGMPDLLMDGNSVEDEVVDKYVPDDVRVLKIFEILFQVRDEYRKDYDPGRGGFGKRFTPATEMDKGGPV